VSWDFVVSNVSDWTLTLYLSASGGNIAYFSTSGDTSGSGTVTGSGSLSATTTDASTDVSLLAQFEVFAPPDTDVSVPSGSSFDFAPAASPVPEPATTGLLAAGLAWMGWRLRKVRRR